MQLDLQPGKKLLVLGKRTHAYMPFWKALRYNEKIMADVIHADAKGYRQTF